MLLESWVLANIGKIKTREKGEEKMIALKNRTKKERRSVDTSSYRIISALLVLSQ